MLFFCRLQWIRSWVFFMWPLETHRCWLCLRAHCQAHMFGIISNYTDRSCTSSRWKTLNCSLTCHAAQSTAVWTPQDCDEWHLPVPLLQITLGVCFILMFGNSMLLTSFYASSLVSIWVSGTLESQVLCVQSFNALRFIGSVKTGSVWSMDPAALK